MADHLCFVPCRERLNPKFESYKLEGYDQSNLRRIPLPTAIDLAIDPRFKSFNYHELRSKSSWNHLLLGSFTDTPAQLIWIEPRTLHISTLLQPDSHDPQVAPLLRLPDGRAEQLQDHADQGIEFDYPTGFALNYYHLVSSPQDNTRQHLWLFLDGGNTLFLVDLNPRSPPQILAQKHLLSHGFMHAFYKLASVQVKDRQTDTFWIVVRAKSMQPTSESAQADVDMKKNGSHNNNKKKKKLTYTLYVAEMKITPNQDSSTADHPIMPFDLDIQIHARLVGAADVLSVHYDRPGHRWCFRSTCKFTTLTQQTSQPAQPEEHTKGLHHEQPLQAKEERDSKPVAASSAVYTPYSWSQTLSSLTVVFHIPFPITSKSIQVLLQHKCVCFKLPALDSLPQEAEEYLERLFGYFGQPALLGNKTDGGGGGGGSLVLDFWDHIAVEDSTWFVEQASGNTQSAGSRTILTIELEKRSRLRWPQAFQADAQVTETMDPIELLAITENLAKYTSAGDDDDDDDAVPSGHEHPSKKQKRGLGSSAAAANPSASSSNAGAHPLMQPSSLSAGEMDEEIDVANDVMVTGVVLTWLMKKEPHESRAEAADRTDSEWDVVVAQDGIPVEQISSPLKVVRLDRPPAPQQDGSGTSSWSGEEDGSMMIKADIDGLVFSSPEGGADRKSMRWRHEQSFPALAFVMASKREIWASFYTRDMCLVFETCSSVAKDRLSLGNLFVYHHTPPRAPLSVQRVVQLSCSTPAQQPSSSDDAAPLPLILGLCALQNPAPAPSNTPPPLSIVLLAQHEILLFDL